MGMRTTALKKYLHRNSILISAFMISGLIYGVFFAQGLYSDVVTFAKSGDQLRQCYPVFLKLSEVISQGKLSGITIGTFNGVGNISGQTAARYVPQLLFAAIANFIDSRVAYILFYWFHLFLIIYYGQKISVDILDINGYGRYLFPISAMTVSLLNSWFTSFMALGAMIFPAIYYSFLIAKGDKYQRILPMSLIYVLIFTSGYHIYACICALLIAVISSAYGSWSNPKEKKLAIVKRAWIPGIIGGMVSFPYLLGTFIDVATRTSGGQDLADVLALPLYPPDLIGTFINSYVNTSPIEQIGLLRIGIAWSIAIFFMLKDHVIERLPESEKKLFLFGIVINIILLLISMGSRTPFAIWLFLVPVFGGAHLPIRYFILTLPFFYLSLCIGWKHLNKPSKKLCVASFLLVLLCTVGIDVATKVGITSQFDLGKLWLDLIFASFLLYIVAQKGWQTGWSVLCICLITGTVSVNGFYVWNEISLRSETFNERSIVFNSSRQEVLENFIDQLDKKDIYRWIELDAKESVPGVIPNRLDEYGCFQYHLTNYLSYSLHGKDIDYIKGNQISWFDRFDWGYLLDTQADILIIDNEKWELDSSFYEGIVDPSCEKAMITSNLFAVKLKKFIPQYYIESGEYVPHGTYIEYRGEEYYLNENEGYLDNGIFYCPTLDSDCLTSFNANYIDYFSGEFSISKTSSIQFLLYPNPYFRFYDNGVEITPIIDHRNASIAYFRLEPGNHCIEIKYENTLDDISCAILLGFSAFCICSDIYFRLFKIYREKRNKRRRKSE